ncbi:MAG TPA: GrpB family protein [Mycobacteriales bacterium]
MGAIVVPYDPDWPGKFEAERDAVVAALGDLVGTVEHIGSTSVPGMPAKPVIDMMAAVHDLGAGDRAEPLLAGRGYRRTPHRVDAVLFNRFDGDTQTHALHLTVPGSDLWRERLAFRDALRADPALIAEYAQLKQRLLAEAGGRVYSARGKRAFVRRVLAGAGIDLEDGMYTA